MADKEHSQTPAQSAKAEEAARKQARLSQALKANMARRKGQARARAADVTQSASTGSAQDAENKET
ncbi:hypothetical protein [uncultured Sulfitobacter sp.]|uniref:hypothetical protein n=1 Tax=uncultured Sulfitobacter sp. TaxID=191468 RepID=UPI00260887C2|nr:hypothetical protein [uncultured Sulfitobacter sp.]